MSDSLGDLLGRMGLEEPPEIALIKDFVRENYNAGCQITVQPAQIVIVVRGASLAGALRMRLHELKALCQTDKRLVLRITT